MCEPAHSTKEAFIADSYWEIESLHEAHKFEIVVLVDRMRT